LLDSLALSGNERLLDVGCGCGAVLLLAAQRLPRARTVGVDLWSTADQSGNSEEVTRRNAELEGVRGRIELHTADMRRLPFADASFDVVTSSLAVHNIADMQGREHALGEMLRVLRPKGMIMLADILHTGEYDRYFSSQPNTKVERRRLGWRFWYGGPHAATTLIKVRYSP
jgi:arsenite methyltransferase